MSIFDLYHEKPLKGDKNHRHVKNEVLEYEHFKKDAGGDEIFNKNPKTLLIPYLICCVVLSILVGQLLRLQISQGSFNRTLAEGNRIRSREIIPPRGLIYDSQGEILAKNKASYDLEIYPLDLPRKQDEKDQVLEKISSATQIPKTEINAKIKEKGLLTYDPIVLKGNIDRDTALILQIKTINLPGVVVAKKPIREYADVKSLGHIIGFVGKMTQEDIKNYPSYKPFYELGKEGLEISYEKFLQGKPGLNEIEVDSQGREQRELRQTLPEPGNNLVLSLNSGLQNVMANYLEAEVNALGSSGGAAIAMNPQNGQILGLVSIPEYSNNIFSSSEIADEYQKLLDDPSKPLFNRAISGTYPSGSIIKPVIAAAGLEDGTITASTTINDPGEIKVGNYTYPDWKSHGLVDVRKALAESCNVFFYSVAGGWDKIKGLGITKLDNYLKQFGFGEQTGIDIPGEARGIVPDPVWKEKVKKEMWYLGDTYHLGIGQGDFLITPLQMVNAVSAIANGGQLMKPQLVAKITDQDGNTIYETPKEIIRQGFINNDNVQIVREGMRQAVTTGSAQQLNDLPEMVAAKTGTAQFGNEDKTHAWMVSFAPYHNPEIAIIVLIEGGGEGYATAGPVTKQILNWYLANK